MFTEMLDSVLAAAEKKRDFYQKNKIGHFVSSMWGGASVGIGTLLIAVIGAIGYSAGYPMTKLVMGGAFSLALMIVVLASFELFTGNNLVMFTGAVHRKISVWKMVEYWIYNYFGNFAGSIVIAYVFLLTIDRTGETARYLNTMAHAKVDGDFITLLARGIFCNILVCLPVLISYKIKSESAKIGIIFMCIFAFVVMGFEHSVANMTLFSSIVMIGQEGAVTMSQMLGNLIPVTIGNIIGGAILVGGSLCLMARGESLSKKSKKL